MTTFRDGGWDTFRFNRLHASDTLQGSTRALVDEVHELKRQGYRQVALAGQSFGAFLSLMAADASDEVDAIVATAPAAYGSFADFYDTWRSNATELYALLEQVRRARGLIFYFPRGGIYAGGRGGRPPRHPYARPAAPPGDQPTARPGHPLGIPTPPIIPGLRQWP